MPALPLPLPLPLPLHRQLLKLLQAKAKAHSKSLRMLGAELDSFQRKAKGGEDDLEAYILKSPFYSDFI